MYFRSEKKRSVEEAKNYFNSKIHESDPSLLSLHFDMFSDDSVEKLVQFLKSNDKITKLNLMNNKLTESGLKKLLDYLKKQKHVMCVNFHTGETILEPSPKQNEMLQSLKNSSDHISVLVSFNGEEILKESTRKLKFSVGQFSQNSSGYEPLLISEVGQAASTNHTKEQLAKIFGMNKEQMEDSVLMKF